MILKSLITILIGISGIQEKALWNAVAGNEKRLSTNFDTVLLVAGFIVILLTAFIVLIHHKWIVCLNNQQLGILLII